MADTLQTYVEVEAYLQVLAARMNLSNWRIVVLDEEPESEENVADVEPSENVQAKIRLAKHFYTYSAEKQRAVCVHELSHLISDRLKSVSRTFIWQMKGLKAQALAEEQLSLADENLAENLSIVLSPFMPLPAESAQRDLGTKTISQLELPFR